MSELYLTKAVSYMFDLIIFVLFVTILLSWFPKINWYKEPFKSMRAFSEFFLAPFRRIIPPIGGLDFSPIVAFVVIQIIGNLLISILANFKL